MGNEEKRGISIATRFTVSFSVLLVLFLLTAGFAFSVMWVMAERMQDAVDLGVSFQDDIYRANLSMERARNLQRRFLTEYETLGFTEASGTIAPLGVMRIRQAMNACDRLRARLQEAGDSPLHTEALGQLVLYLDEASHYLAEFTDSIVVLSVLAHEETGLLANLDAAGSRLEALAFETELSARGWDFMYVIRLLEKNYLLHKQPSELDAFRVRCRRFGELLDQEGKLGMRHVLNEYVQAMTAVGATYHRLDSLGADFDRRFGTIEGISEKLLEIANAEALGLKSSVGRFLQLAMGPLALAVLLAILMTGGVAYHLRRFVTKNVLLLTQAADRIRHGDLDARVEIDARDELGELADTMNSTAATLKDKLDELMLAKIKVEQSNLEMERRVHERTAELDQINRLLASEVHMRKQTEKAMRKAKDEAEAATRAKSEFLANTSHEIRTPMNAIIGMTYLAKKTELTPVQRDYLEKIDISAKALLDVINDILDLSKVEAGMLSVEQAGFRLDEVFEQLATIIFPKASEKELEFLIGAGDDVPVGLVGDSLRLSQILINLCNNAVKFTDSGEVVVRADVVSREEESVRLRFSVKDDGIGIAPEAVDELFEAFTQADASTTRQYGGTGLGLNLSRKLVELMGGAIGVESEVGVGSTFWVEVPFSVLDETPARRMPDCDLGALNVLVVDDSLNSRNILSGMLGQLAGTVATADSGEKGLSMVRQAVSEDPFDLLILDWRMPGMDGLELGRILRDDETISPTPDMLMVSAYSDKTLMEQTAELGFLGLLYKPVAPNLLRDILVDRFAPGERDLAVDDEPQAQETHLSGVEILLVEDNEINRQVASEILCSVGIRVHSAEDGQQALDFLDAQTVDAVLMDVQMPVMDGLEATRRLRAQDRFQALPIIAMTANAMDEDRQKSADAGMNDHISKPFDADELFAVIGKWVDAPTGDRDVYAVPREQPAADDVPGGLPESLPGIDMQDGLRRARGNAKLYRDLLLLLDEKYAGSGEAMEAALAEDRRDDAIALAHSLKGTSGMMGAVPLFEAAGALEQALRTGEENSGLLQTFKRRLAVVLEGIRQLDDGQGAEEAEARGVDDSSVLLESLDALEDALGTSSPIECKERSGAVAALTWPESVRQMVRDMVKRTNEYDFQGALEMVALLKEQLAR